MSSLLPSAPADEGVERCPAGACPDIVLFGALIPGCCRGVESCGGRVRLGERSWLCVPPDYEQTAEALRAALAAHAGEPLVADPSCPSHGFDAVTLTGCCITGGTCGVSTEPWTTAAARLGLKLPSACIPAGEAAEIARSAIPDAGPAQACTGLSPKGR